MASDDSGRDSNMPQLNPQAHLPRIDVMSNALLLIGCIIGMG